VSIVLVTVVKNDLTGLEVTAKSVISQNCKVSWIIVTPFDHSPTFQFAESLKNEGIVRETIHDLGQGIYTAMNTSLPIIEENEWVWFLNAGDEFASVETFCNATKSIEKSSHQWVFGSHIISSSLGHALGIKVAPKSFNAREQLYSKNHISHQATVFSKRILNVLGGFNENYRIAADWDLIVRASKLDPGENINMLMCIFKMGGFSTLNRQLANNELWILRSEHIYNGRSLMNFTWYQYRKLRNFLVIHGEKFFPNILNSIRKRKLSIKNILMRKKIC